MTKSQLAWRLWLFGLLRIRLIGFVRPRIIDVSEQGMTIRIPLSRRTRNHVGSQYLAVQTIGADLACGFYAYYLMEVMGVEAPPVFKTMQAHYLKRAEGDVDFTCSEYDKVQEMVQYIKEHPGQRITKHVNVVATCNGEEVALFDMELSLKAKA